MGSNGPMDCGDYGLRRGLWRSHRLRPPHGQRRPNGLRQPHRLTGSSILPHPHAPSSPPLAPSTPYSPPPPPLNPPIPPLHHPATQSKLRSPGNPTDNPSEQPELPKLPGVARASKVAPSCPALGGTAPVHWLHHKRHNANTMLECGMSANAPRLSLGASGGATLSMGCRCSVSPMAGPKSDQPNVRQSIGAQGSVSLDMFLFAALCLATTSSMLPAQCQHNTDTVLIRVHTRGIVHTTRVQYQCNAGAAQYMYQN